MSITDELLENHAAGDAEPTSAKHRTKQLSYPGIIVHDEDAPLLLRGHRRFPHC